MSASLRCVDVVPSGGSAPEIRLGQPGCDLLDDIARSATEIGRLRLCSPAIVQVGGQGQPFPQHPVFPETLRLRDRVSYHGVGVAKSSEIAVFEVPSTGSTPRPSIRPYPESGSTVADLEPYPP
jgi:hypothetical protein